MADTWLGLIKVHFVGKQEAGNGILKAKELGHKSFANSFGIEIYCNIK